jgi:MFS family permease
MLILIQLFFSADPTRRSGKKWVIVLLCSFFCMMAAFGASSFGIAVPSMQTEIHVSDEVGFLALAVYPLGFGITPLFLAPFSEA